MCALCLIDCSHAPTGRGFAQGAVLILGYLMADVDKEVSADIKKKLDALPDTIKTRCLW